MTNLDRIDLEHIQQGSQTRFWEILRQRINQTVTRANGRLLQETQAPEIYRLQGEIRGALRILELPGIIVDEIRKAYPDATT